MAGAVKTSDQLKQAVILRNAGYSLASITERTGISASTLSRHFAKHKVAKGGLSTEAVELARQQLLADGGLIDQLKHEIAAAVVDDVAHVKRLREASALLLEELMADTSLPPHYKTRGLAALSTTLRLTQEAARKALRVEEMQPEATELPELIVTELSNEDIERMRQEQQSGAVYDEPDADVIEESFTDD